MSKLPQVTQVVSSRTGLSPRMSEYRAHVDLFPSWWLQWSGETAEVIDGEGALFSNCMDPVEGAASVFGRACPLLVVQEHRQPGQAHLT